MVRLSAAVTAGSTHLDRDGFVTGALGGAVLSATGGVQVSRVGIEGTYAEGVLSPSPGVVGVRETLADASLLVLFDAGRGLRIGGGPHWRAFLAPSATVRWMRTELHARYERELIPGLATTDVAVWQVLSADVNAQGGADGGRGAVAGLTIQLPNSPFALRAAYTADRMAYANGTAEFVDHVEVGLRFRRD